MADFAVANLAPGQTHADAGGLEAAHGIQLGEPLEIFRLSHVDRIRFVVFANAPAIQNDQHYGAAHCLIIGKRRRKGKRGATVASDERYAKAKSEEYSIGLRRFALCDLRYYYPLPQTNRENGCCAIAQHRQPKISLQG